ncbi:putative phosphatase [Rhodovulum sp. PH10]|uniref:histidine phosphatase family protein n=1 Tax=Rhodovulum sp. PH10 TaxID=1187851 RepID=UPI00027C2083|nr:histidine phosphatase family protein [Rhodovulum sp. PH10]EJW10368.1 putative phosphatase [Rhodovulum sp. PH10]
MTTFFLVRHGTHALQHRVLAGRMPGVVLADEGRRQALALAERLAAERPTALLASPRRRTRETAAPLAAATGLAIAIAPEVDEVNMGDWTGKSFEEISGDPRWTAWNTARASARVPGGESMGEVAQRIGGLLDRLAGATPDGRIVIVSHGDVIRSALLDRLGLSLDAYDRIEIATGSVSTLVVGPWGAKILAMGERPASPAETLVTPDAKPFDMIVHPT